MRIAYIVTALGMVPGLLAAQQQDPLERLAEVLPANVAEQVLAVVAEAQSRGLPDQAVANLALQGVAQGRSGEEVLAAAREMVATLNSARRALEEGGRIPDGSEVQAGAMAMRMGVDGEAISALASSAPSGRSLAVPLAVLGGLVDRGLPSDQALQATQARLADRATDLEMMDMPGEAGRMVAEGMRPGEVGLALASGRAGFTVPVGGMSVPVGAPRNGGAGTRPTGAPERPATPGSGENGGQGARP